MTLQEILDKRKELRSKLETASESEMDAIEEQLKDLDAEERNLANVERRNAIARRISSDSSSAIEIRKPVEVVEERNENVTDSKEYRSAFFKRLAGVELNDAEKRAMTTASNSAGAVVPTQTLNKILEKLQATSIVYGLVTVSHLRGNVVIPLEDTTGDAERKAEGADGTIQSDKLGSLTLGAKKYIKLLQLTCELEATSIDALEDYIVAKLVKKLNQAFDADIISGSGTNCATGILTTITALQTGTINVLVYDDLCTLFGALPATAKTNATLMMSTNTLYNRVAKIKDDVKRPIFDIATGKVLGRSVVECDFVPDDTIIFGDFSEYMFNWNKDPEIAKSTEQGFKSGDSVFRILALADGKLADLGAMKALKVKTA